MTEPPNLRLSDSDEDCGSCAAFDQGFCTMYHDRPVDESMVCDSWYAKDDDDGE